LISVNHGESYYYKAYWVKEVQFDDKEEKEIIVKYTADLGYTDGDINLSFIL